MWIECPAVFKKRIDKEIINCKSLTLTRETPQQIIQNLREEYDMNDLKRFGRWKNGSLPYMYVIPKDKDPYNKSRLIASYYDHPLKYVYKNTSKIITWCFRQIEKSKHFTLYKITDIMSKTKDAARWLRRNGSDQAILTANRRQANVHNSTTLASKTQSVGCTKLLTTEKVGRETYATSSWINTTLIKFIHPEKEVTKTLGPLIFQIS